MSRLLLTHPLKYLESSVMSRSFVPRAYSASQLLGLKPGDTDCVFGAYRQIPDAQPIIERKPAVQDLTPAQQMGLLYLRKSDLSKLVYAKLLHSTARAGAITYRELESLRFAERKPDGFHRLSYLGWIKANDLADELAKQFGITVPKYYSRRRGFTLGMSQAGNA